MTENEIKILTEIETRGPEPWGWFSFMAWANARGIPCREADPLVKSGFVDIRFMPTGWQGYLITDNGRLALELA